jgi:hypothetical protein
MRLLKLQVMDVDAAVSRCLGAAALCACVHNQRISLETVL